MLRVVLVLAALAVGGLGSWLIARGIRAAGIYLLVVGAGVCVGTLFERWRYRPDERRAKPLEHWQRTGERFEDPHTGNTIEVYFDPRSGERRYVTAAPGEQRSQP